MEKPLKIFRNLRDVLDNLPTKNWCYFWSAVLDYYFDGVEPEIDKEDLTNITLWASIKTLVDLANSDRRAITSPENGKKRRKKNTDPKNEY